MSQTDHLHQQRMRGIETLLLWEGEVSNARLRQLYEFSVVRASQLIAGYRQLNPDGLQWDPKARVYRRTPGFRLRCGSNEMEDYDQLVFGHKQPFVVDARIDFTQVDPDLFANLYRACASGRGLTIAYRSMTHPEGSERIIYPHHVVRIGRRWHARAWCALRNEFRDFAVGRMAQAQRFDLPPPQDAIADQDWEQQVELEIVAHPALSPAQAKVIATEYFGGTDQRRITIRRCLARYVAQDLHAATDPLRQRPPEYQLAVANARRLKGLLFEADS